MESDKVVTFESVNPVTLKCQSCHFKVITLSFLKRQSILPRRFYRKNWQPTAHYLLLRYKGD